MISTISLDDVLSRLAGMPPAERRALENLVVKARGNAKWTPNPGPQTAAYLSDADVLLYGGAGGGGKSSLILGLALTAHKRSLVMRRQYTDLGALTEEAVAFNGTRAGFNASPPPKLRTTDGRLIEFGAASKPGDEESFQGRPHDLLAFDEAAQFAEAQVRFLMGWVRSTDPNQRCRVVLATNPPIGAEGQWLSRMFAPWLDPLHPNPAKPGELRWFVTNSDGEDEEVDGPEPVEVGGQVVTPKSRTFIPAKLADNPFLANTGYQATLDALPEPIRSAVRDGNFSAVRKDADRQVIPSDWIRQAQARWRPDGGKSEPMTAIGLDPAGGGRDSAVVACRHGGWYAPLVEAKGEETADGSATAAMVTRHRRHHAPVVVDVGGGYASGVILRFKDNGIPYRPFNGAGESSARTKDGQLKFANRRAEAWWKMREELDPDQEGGSVIALPPDPELAADLAAPTWDLSARGILIEAKVKYGADGRVSGGVRRKLGRSPGKGDAVVMALSEGNRAAMRMRVLGASAEEQGLHRETVIGGPYGRRPQVIMGHQAARRQVARA